MLPEASGSVKGRMFPIPVSSNPEVRTIRFTSGALSSRVPAEPQLLDTAPKIL
jgi:hypothetical protein